MVVAWSSENCVGQPETVSVAVFILRARAGYMERTEPSKTSVFDRTSAFFFFSQQNVPYRNVTTVSATRYVGPSKWKVTEQSMFGVYCLPPYLPTLSQVVICIQ